MGLIGIKVKHKAFGTGTVTELDAQYITNVILVYHALTNDLICRFNIPEGVGDVVSLPKGEKVLSIEEEMHLYYENDYTAKKNFGHLR